MVATRARAKLRKNIPQVWAYPYYADPSSTLNKSKHKSSYFVIAGFSNVALSDKTYFAFPFSVGSKLKSYQYRFTLDNKACAKVKLE